MSRDSTRKRKAPARYSEEEYEIDQQEEETWGVFSFQMP